MFTKIYNMYKDKSEKEFKYKKENVINELLKISFKLKNIIKNNNKNIDEYKYLIDCKKYKNQELKELNYALRNIKNKKFEQTTNAQQFQFLPIKQNHSKRTGKNMTKQMPITADTVVRLNSEMFVYKIEKNYVMLKLKKQNKYQIKNENSNNINNLYKLLNNIIQTQSINKTELRFIRKFAYFHNKYAYKFKFKLDGISTDIFVYCDLQFDQKGMLISSKMETKRIKVTIQEIGKRFKIISAKELIEKY